MTKRLGLGIAKLVGLILLIAVVADAQNRGLGGSILRLSSTAADALCIGSLAASPAASACTGGAYLGPTTVTGLLKAGSSPVTLTNSTGNIISAALATTGVSAASYGSASLVPVLTINAQGQVTAASTAAVLPPGQMTLMSGCAGSGTSTAVGATNVATCAISGLTTLDTLQVFVTHSTVTQDTAVPMVYNSTDSVNILSTNGGTALSDGSFYQDIVWIRANQEATTSITAVGARNNTGTGLHSTFTTAWTDPWTMALRHGGVTSGGTYRYRWAVYRITGQ